MITKFQFQSLYNTQLLRELDTCISVNLTDKCVLCKSSNTYLTHAC